MARLMDYDTNEDIREATGVEARDSATTARTDGGAGVIEVDGR